MALVVKNLPASAGGVGDVGLIPALGRSLGGGQQSTPVFLPGEPHEQRSLAGCSALGLKELDLMEATACRHMFPPAV